MSVGFGSIGAEATGTSDPTAAVPAPAGLAVGDLDVLFVNLKSSAVTIIDVSGGYTSPANGQITGGAGTVGTDAGPNRVAVYTREIVGGESDPVVDLSAAPNSYHAYRARFTKGANEVWEPVVCASAADTTGSSTSYGTVTGNQTIDLQAGDWIGQLTGFNGDAGTPGTRTFDVPGATLGTYAAHLNDDNTVQGGDLRTDIGTRPYLSGTVSGAPTLARTWTSGNANFSGATIFFRLRAVPANTRPSVVDTKQNSIENAPCTITTDAAQTLTGRAVVTVAGSDWGSLSEMTAPTGDLSGWQLLAEADLGTNNAHMKVWATTVPSDGAKQVSVNAPGGGDAWNVTMVVKDAGNIANWIADGDTVLDTVEHTPPILNLVPDNSLWLGAVLSQTFALVDYTVSGTMIELVEVDNVGTMSVASDDIGVGGTHGGREFTCNVAVDCVAAAVAIPPDTGGGTDISDAVDGTLAGLSGGALSSAIDRAESIDSLSSFTAGGKLDSGVGRASVIAGNAEVSSGEGLLGSTLDGADDVDGQGGFFAGGVIDAEMSAPGGVDIEDTVIGLGALPVSAGLASAFDRNDVIDSLGLVVADGALRTGVGIVDTVGATTPLGMSGGLASSEIDRTDTIVGLGSFFGMGLVTDLGAEKLPEVPLLIPSGSVDIQSAFRMGSIDPLTSSDSVDIQPALNESVGPHAGSVDVKELMAGTDLSA